MPYENTFALLAAIRMYLDKADTVDEIKKYVDTLMQAMTDDKKVHALMVAIEKAMSEDKPKQD